MHNEADEAWHQKQYMDWIKLLGLFPFVMVSASQGKRTPGERAKLKRTGWGAGHPDWFLSIPSGQYHGLFIELKTPRIYKPVCHKLQKDKLKLLNEAGYCAVFCFGHLAAEKSTEQYLKGLDLNNLRKIGRG